MDGNHGAGRSVMAEIRFRFAKEKDCRLILKFIRSLARYEKMSDEVVAPEQIMSKRGL